MEVELDVGFIGCGNMAEALIKGLLASKPNLTLYGHEPLANRREELSVRYPLRFCADNLELARECRIIFLAVKPQVADAVLKELKSVLRHDRLLISIMAGISTVYLEGYFSSPTRIVRAMPNTPALVGQGATAICSGSAALAGDMETAESLLSAVGSVFPVSEAQMDSVTGLSGSGPAYVFTFIEALADAGVLEGLPRDTALSLAVQTVLGAAALVQESGAHPAALRDKVCSPGGTTIRAMKTLEKNGFHNAVMEAVMASASRSRQLGKK